MNILSKSEIEIETTDKYQNPQWNNYKLSDIKEVSHNIEFDTYYLTLYNTETDTCPFVVKCITKYEYERLKNMFPELPYTHKHTLAPTKSETLLKSIKITNNLSCIEL